MPRGVVEQIRRGFCRRFTMNHSAKQPFSGSPPPGVIGAAKMLPNNLGSGLSNEIINFEYEIRGAKFE